MSEHEISFDAMGSRIRLIIGEPLDASRPSAEAAAESAHRWLQDFDARMSRFRPDSELCALNADPREAVPASALLCATVAAGLWAARRSDGLVDPTLIDAIENRGYISSLDGVAPASLRDAIAAAPARRAASPSAAARWRLIIVDDEDGVIHRPPGLRFDSGGAGKGLSAGALAQRLSGYSRVAIDCGGDVCVAGPASREEPFELEIEHPLTRETAHRFWLGDGAVATSGINTRIWQLPDGRFAHHLLDPSTGEPAWTGLIQATAIATSALEAETLSKMALLSGPEAAREILAPFGGAVVHDSGEVELIGSLDFKEVAA
jgi:thiamine biosynthesis lipoprotein